MFRRKHDIPQEPVIPTPEQILEDIQNSPDDDCAFHNMPNAETESMEERVISSNTNATFDKIQAFVELHENMKSSLVQMEDKSELLKINVYELKAIADDIKKLSTEALR